ncbi:MAG: lamin tail domain-containing protein [Candidatus Eisenbacteria bacterium]|uniref:Lamin tail domain-containing protein n=1 Tax=Eiseniibacteriota bacterium TaxID=2212470 RepID=A0A933SE69_UNCEI|nr:lamin tail domain-containing protein [Candidatus Eisenbacteria bacterium]
MKKLATILGLTAVLAIAATSAFAGAVRISQVYSGGGGTGAATYKQDYVELFNSSGSPVNVGGWVIEYGSATGTWGSAATNYAVIPAGTIIQPCSYWMAGVGTVGTGGAAFPITPDFTVTAGPNMSSSNGKVALFNTLNANTACGSELAGTLEDKIAWGTATCAEGTATAAVSITLGIVRNNGGMTDTNNNSLDCTLVSNPTPRNSASPANTACLATPTVNKTWGSLKSIYR